ncbi:unnamed protein product [Hymenolepis diminuta]|uniref:Uncharacterized protein n=1 Tax=Hymenolepis diminuta TaxID=6216 RepID=A0A564YN66_HYMDI|nr:unnamed protein product [Hymenolepis diminuta]
MRVFIFRSQFTMSLQLSSSERDSGIHNSVEENSAAFNYKDSLTSSFSSVMADSFYFSQSDDASLRTCSFIENSAREAIVKRLEELKNDFAVVNQIYLIHRQRAFETNQSAFRKACKCNVQKLKEIQQEKLALEAKLREIEASEQLSCVGCSRLCRSTSVSVKEDCYIPVTATSTVATLPRRKTLRIPSLSHSGTLRLGKLRKHPNVKQVEFENTPQTPIIGSAKPVKSGGLRHVPSSLRGLRFQLLPARLRMPRSQTIVQRVHLDPVSSSQVRGIPTDDSNTLRPQSMYATVYSSRVCNSMDDLRKAQLQKHFSASGPNLLDVNGSEQSSNLGDKISPMVPTGDSELTGMFGDLNISTSGVTPKDTTSPTDSDGQSTSGAFSMTSQEFSLLGETEVCLRRPMKVSPEESPIRCICSCISDHGDGNCDCFEESCEDSKEGEEKSDSGVGHEEEEIATPTPVRSKLPVIMPSRQPRRSLNPFSLLRAQNGRRGPLWKR